MTTPAQMISPATVAELVDAVRAAPRVIAVGAGTKPRLAEVGAGFVRVSTTRLSGMIEYDPGEFTFTALAGTPVREIAAALAERGQYLPFDPLFGASGATIGGTLAAGLSGPGQVRYGAVRDFILGVRLVDGEGRLLRLGGKVVKNAAGFDVPKFLVGSAGRFGIVAEVTFKVFPKPAATRTLRLEAKDDAAKAQLLTSLAAGRWECDALDAAVGEPAVFVRLAGPAAALEPIGADILSRWPGSAMTSGDASYLWQSVVDVRWAHASGSLVKVALTPAGVPEFIAFVRARAGLRGWITAGGNVGFVSLPAGVAVPRLSWPAVLLRGAGPLWPGANLRFEFMRRVKEALDPQARFPALDEKEGGSESESESGK